MLPFIFWLYTVFDIAKCGVERTQSNEVRWDINDFFSKFQLSVLYLGLAPPPI